MFNDIRALCTSSIENGAKVIDKGWPIQDLPAKLPSEEEFFRGRD